MLVYLSCECGKQVPVSEGAAGTSLPCTCGRAIKVPSLGELRQRVTEGDVPFFPAQVKPPPHPVTTALRIGCASLVFLFGVALFIGTRDWVSLRHDTLSPVIAFKRAVECERDVGDAG